MILDSMLQLPATVYRYGEGVEDDYGNATLTFTPDPDPIGSWVDLRGRTTESSEVQGRAEWLIDTIDIYLRDPTITGNDEVEVTFPDGIKRRYEMLGNPHTFIDPLTLEHVYTACVARLVT